MRRRHTGTAAFCRCAKGSISKNTEEIQGALSSDLHLATVGISYLIVLQKWTGSRSLGERFSNEILGDSKSFTRRDFQPLITEYTELLKTIQAASSDVSEVSTLRTISRRQSVQIQQASTPQAYWNEYDDGSEAENEPYTIYIDPEAEATFPGSKTFRFVFAKAKGPVDSVRKWFSPYGSPEERQPINVNRGTSYFTDTPGDTDVEDGYASSSDFPSGYAAHYASFPSVTDQKAARQQEVLLFRTTLLSFAASLVLLAIASILVATGRHRLRVEVDAGVIVGMVSSLFFATLGFGTMLYRKDNLGWLHKLAVTLTFAGVCIFNGILLVVVAGNTAF